MPHRLTYDTLPAHSRLRREMSGGALRITAAAEEPGPIVRREALLRAAAPAAWISVATLAVAVAAVGSLFLDNRRFMSSGMLLVLGIFMLLFCAALFGFVWRAQYALRLDAAEKALRQNTALAAQPGRLLIESAGPLGSASHELQSIEGLRIGQSGYPVPQNCVEIVMFDGTRIRILIGRDLPELRWVVRALADSLSRRPGEGAGESVSNTLADE